MKNIAIDVRCLLEERLTGVGEYTFNLLKSIFDIDRNNQYFLFYNQSEPFLGHIKKLEAENVTLCGFKIPNKFLNLSLGVFGRPFLDSLVETQCKTKIHQFFFPNINFLSVSPLCKYMVTCHDLSFEIFPYFFSTRQKLWHKAVRPKRIFERAEKIISVSANTKKDLIQEYNLNPNKIEVIHSGIDINLDKSKNGEIKRKYDLPERYILSLGTLEPRKNIETLIQAFAMLKKQTEAPHKLIIAGGKGWKYKKIFELAAKTDLAKDIIFIGYIPASDKPNILALADVFVYPSFYEGFGFPPIEAMASRCPVISSHVASLPEICENAALLIDPYSIVDLFFAMKEVLRDKNLRVSLIGKGFVQSSKFSWPEAAEKFLKLIN
ncbi:MAG TPA: glycosyltransferase family 1 protein [Candidatus Bipolaricaulota bacterium]|nr:glycosyltransferase family 1 protein [Candidatus Bipolaricaulota bacterium]